MKKIIVFFLFLGAAALPAAPVLAASAKPAKDFFPKTWAQTSKAKQYSTVCTVTAGPVTVGGNLAEDEQKNLTLLDKLLGKYKSVETGALAAKDKRVGGKKTVAGAGRVYAQYASQAISYEEALEKMEQPDTIAGQFILSPQGIFYSSDGSSWRVFSDKELNNSLYNGLVKTPPTSYFNKPSFQYAERTANKQLVYKGKSTADEANDIVSAIDSTLKGSQKGAATTVTIDEKTRQWKKSEITLQIRGSKASFPVKKACAYSFGAGVAVSPPKAAEKVAADVGRTEFFTLMNSLR